MNLAVLLVVLMSRVIFTLVSSQRTVQCPSSCECSSQYYVYCQSTSLNNHQLADVISQVSPSAVLLDLSSNNITSIPANSFISLSNLEYLNLAANGITELRGDAFQGLSKLRELTLNQNRISVLRPGCFNGLISLKELNIEDNVVEALPGDVFRNMSLLNKLQLQNNRISDLLPKQFFGLNNLQSLNISHNSLTSVINLAFSGLRSLQLLSLTDNNLCQFQMNAFSGLTNLEALMLDRNNISDIIFLHGNDFYLSLNSVSLTENYIVSIPSHVFPHNSNLKKIDICCNIIRRIGGNAFGGLHLEYLNLERNNISEINTHIFKDVRRISNLNLGRNRIMDVQTGAFDSLRDNIIVLNLQLNKLTYVHPGMFRGMKRLRIFNLAANIIYDIEPGAFKDMEELYELNLSRNVFTVLSSNMISGPSGLRKLVIVCNPLHRLSGFSYEKVDDKMAIESNCTMISSTPTSALITWPYKDGTQLYWSLTIQCVNNVACEVPPHASTLRPYATQVTLSGLKPGAQYFICVTPVFLSSDVNISQCIQVRTQMDSLNGVRHSTDLDDHKSDSSNSSSTSSQTLSSEVILLLSWLILTCLLGN